jgi:hypothetical protein
MLTGLYFENAKEEDKPDQSDPMFIVWSMWKRYDDIGKEYIMFRDKFIVCAKDLIEKLKSRAKYICDGLNKLLSSVDRENAQKIYYYVKIIILNSDKCIHDIKIILSGNYDFQQKLKMIGDSLRGSIASKLWNFQMDIENLLIRHNLDGQLVVSNDFLKELDAFSETVNNYCILMEKNFRKNMSETDKSVSIFFDWLIKYVSTIELDIYSCECRAHKVFLCAVKKQTGIIQPTESDIQLLERQAHEKFLCDIRKPPEIIDANKVKQKKLKPTESDTQLRERQTREPALRVSEKQTEVIDDDEIQQERLKLVKSDTQLQKRRARRTLLCAIEKPIEEPPERIDDQQEEPIEINIDDVL